jgi:hypothetical protein
MHLSEIAGSALSALMGRLVRTVIAALALLLFGLIALYYLTTAGLVALETSYGVVYARLIVGAVYAVAAAIPFVFLMVNRPKAAIAAPTGDGQMSPRNAQITMLVEAVMLGYMLASKTGRARAEH